MWWAIGGASWLATAVLICVATGRQKRARPSRPRMPQIPADTPGEPLTTAEEKQCLLLESLLELDCPADAARTWKALEAELKQREAAGS